MQNRKKVPHVRLIGRVKHGIRDKEVTHCFPCIELACLENKFEQWDRIEFYMDFVDLKKYPNYTGE
jgi:hypothetical protein